MLVLPASESMSAQVAALHNYSTTRCRPLHTTAAPTSASIYKYAPSSYTNRRLVRWSDPPAQWFRTEVDGGLVTNGGLYAAVHYTRTKRGHVHRCRDEVSWLNNSV